MKHLIPPHHRKVPSLLLVQRNRLCHSRFASREQLVNFETTKRVLWGLKDSLCLTSGGLLHPPFWTKHSLGSGGGGGGGGADG